MQEPISKTKRTRIGALGLALSLALASSAGATNLGWASQIVASTGTPDSGSLTYALGAPDSNWVTLGENSATFGSFTDVASYDATTLASVLGVSTAALASSDVILFDANADNAPLGFETSSLTVDDGTSSAVIDHTWTDLPAGAVVANSSLAQASFNSVFGPGAAVHLATNNIGFLLLDLDILGVDASTPGFTLEITGGDPLDPLARPDLMSLATVNVVPEPGTVALLGLGLTGLGLAGRRKRAHR